jgi:hypothetical protein
MMADTPSCIQNSHVVCEPLCPEVALAQHQSRGGCAQTAGEGGAVAGRTKASLSPKPEMSLGLDARQRACQRSAAHATPQRRLRVRFVMGELEWWLLRDRRRGWREAQMGWEWWLGGRGRE